MCNYNQSLSNVIALELQIWAGVNQNVLFSWWSKHVIAYFFLVHKVMVVDENVKWVKM